MNIIKGNKIVVWKSVYGSDANTTSENVRQSKRLFETTIEKVGRKYFYIKGLDAKFDIIKMKEVSDSNYRNQIFSSVEEIITMYKSIEIMNRIRKICKYHSSKKLNISQLIRIDDIINEQEILPKYCAW